LRGLETEELVDDARVGRPPQGHWRLGRAHEPARAFGVRERERGETCTRPYSRLCWGYVIDGSGCGLRQQVWGWS